MDRYQSLQLSLLLPLIAILLAFSYAAYRFAILPPGGSSIPDILLGILLLLSDLFMLIHSVGYSINVLRSTRSYAVTSSRLFLETPSPGVAVVICSYNEEPEVLESTLASTMALDYDPKRIYLLDDSTKPHFRDEAERIAGRYGAEYIHRESRRGFKAGAINDALGRIDAEYIFFLDADQRPSYSLLREAVPLLVADERLAFVQIPQYYANRDASPVSVAAAHQQAVFFEYISEGKSTSNSMFACGTNTLMRRRALLEVGGFDESTVTEDIATSFNIHAKGWRSIYFNKVEVLGEGPTSLAAYFVQQFRWALGTLKLGSKLFKSILGSAGRLKPAQKWEYFLSGTWYYIGWVSLIQIMGPVLFLLLDVRPLHADPLAYASAFLPFSIFSLIQFLGTMARRGYSLKEFWLGISLRMATLPTYILASISAVTGRKIIFGVTPKGKGAGARIPWSRMMPQVALLILSLISGAYGVVRLSHGFDLGIVMNCIWAFYHGALLSWIFVFNRDVKEDYGDRSIFAVYQG